MNLDKTYKVIIESFDVNGYGVTHIDDKVIFVLYALEDEEVLIKIINEHKKYAFAEAVEILKKSPHRVLSLEEIKELSGEIDLAHIDYETELKIKENKVKNTLKLDGYKFNSIIKSDKINHYRNKIMVPFQSINNGEDYEVISGFYEKKSHHIIDSNNDILSNETANNIIYLIKRYLMLFHVPIYNEETKKGIFKEVMIRNTINNDYMVVLIVTKKYDFSNLIEILTNEFKEIKSIYININDNKNNVLLADEFILIYGDKTITENILGLNFEVLPKAFMQVNHDQCEKLYLEALRMAELKKDMNVIDAYCGIGSITLNIAKSVNHVYGIEIVDDAIISANKNKELNNIYNVDFILGSCEDEIVKLSNKNNIDLIIFDPPRKGCDKKFIDTVAEMKIKKIVYISCNIATAKRDIDILISRGYELKEVTPVDLFSRCSHVETITLLVRNDAK